MIKARLLAFSVGIFLASPQMHGQQTVGLFSNSSNAYDGYTLHGAIGSTETYLIDNCGRVVNSWSSDYTAGASSYLMENGDLVRAGRVASEVFGSGGLGGRIERFSWEGELLWGMNFANDTIHQHHDFAVMPGGNILVLVWAMRSAEQAAAAGDVDGEMLWPETVLEIEPSGTDSGSVVWSWTGWEHLVQNVDSTLPNFGEPANFPERFDVNYINPAGQYSGGDFQHFNAICYNAELDQIMLSSKRWSEIYIIDHSTTMEESAGSTGGAAGRGGDLLYRWGNPATYDRGTPADKVLFGQHHPHWIASSLPISGSNPTASVLLFNNGNNRPGGDLSSVDELTLPLLEDGNYAIEEGGTYGPEALDWRYPEELSAAFFGQRISGAQRLPGGTTLICLGPDGRLFEVTDEGELVWEYITAHGSEGPLVQGGYPLGNSTFRATRYAADYAGLSGLDLTPGEPVELDPLPSDCEIFAGLTARLEPAAFAVHPNPFNDHLTLMSDKPSRPEVYELSGRLVWRAERAAKQHEIDLGNLPAGAYLVRASNANLAQLLIKH